jgi:ATP-dependent DNA ligase
MRNLGAILRSSGRVSHDASTSSLLPMEARPVSVLPRGESWRYEPKWDGFRCLAFKQAGQVVLQSKSGKPLTRYFPDVVELLQKLRASSFVLDGELLIQSGKTFSFSDLQMRLHPAESRIRKLAAATPASYMIFDLLRDDDGRDFLQEPFSVRRTALEKFHKRFAVGIPQLGLSPQTKSLVTISGWMAKMAGQIDGIVAKNADDLYAPGERTMQKYKVLRTADCVVGGFRYGAGAELVGSLLLGLYDEARLLNHVGFTSGIADGERAALTRKLEKLIAPPGFTGNAPGGPSRWSTERSAAWKPLKPKLVAEVCFDHVTDSRFRHGTRFMRWRPDKAPDQCTMEQLQQP